MVCAVLWPREALLKAPEQDAQQPQQGCSRLPVLDRHHKHLPSSLHWQGASPSQLDLIVPPSSKTAELKNVVFREAGEKADLI